MGGFQGVAAGLGSAGEETGQGINQALNEALKVRQQQHAEDVDTAHIGLARLGQQQAYTLAQQQHELARQQLIEAGWKDMGATVGKDGNYTRNFYNNQTKENRAVPINGIPPDSAEGLLNHYKTLKGLTDGEGKPLFTDLQAKQIAFKMPNLYREGPVGMLEGFTDYAREKNDDGIGKVKVPGFGSIDISTPEGQAQFGQTMLDTVYQRSLMAAMYRSQHPADQTGWSANEQREYNGLAVPTERMEKLMTQMAIAQIQNTLDPEAQAKIREDLVHTLEPMYKQLDEKRDEINGRHNRIGPGGSPQKGAYRIGNVWYDATTHQPIPAHK